MLAIDIIV